MKFRLLLASFVALLVFFTWFVIDNNKKDSSSQVFTERLETIQGKIFPFDIAISKATHRAEKDDKLVAYLFSDVLDLDKLIGIDLEMDGFFKLEDKQQIFWVKTARPISNQDEATDSKTKRLSTKLFTFLYSKDWSYTISPYGIYYFSKESNDSSLPNVVFLTLSSELTTKEDENIKPNILVAGLTGTKKISQEKLSRKQEVWTLFSSLYERKYIFTFTYNANESDRIKNFLNLINSFVEGEEEVQKIISKEKEAEELIKQQQADIAEKLKNITKEITEKTNYGKNNESDSFFSNIFNKEEELSSSKVELPSPEVENSIKTCSEEYNPVCAEITENGQSIHKTFDNKCQSNGALIINQGVCRDSGQMKINNMKIIGDEEPIEEEEVAKEENMKVLTSNKAPTTFKNLQNDKSFLYTSGYYNFKMRIPFGFWFVNRGARDNKILKIDFSDEDISAKKSGKFNLFIANGGIEKETEKVENDIIAINFPRNSTTHFSFVGNIKYYNAMKSIAMSIEKIR